MKLFSLDAYALARPLRRLGIYASLYRIVRSIQRMGSRQAASDAAFESLQADLGKIAGGLKEASRTATKRVLISGWTTYGSIAMQLPIVAAFVRAGYRPIVILPSRADTKPRALYGLAGVEDFVYWSELKPAPQSVGKDRLETQSDLLSVGDRGMRIGRYALSSMMRNLRRGRFELSEDEDRYIAQRWLLRSRDAAAFADFLISSVKPDALLVDDRGYIPLGPLFERAINEGVAAFTWNAAHRNDAIILKRYERSNIDEHPTSLCPEVWTELQQRPWSDSNWDHLRAEITRCYKSGQWYGEVGTQFGKSLQDKQALVRRLQLDPEKPTVLIFPHIFWDGTFFWGTDLFSDYEEFFTAAVRVAYATPDANWIIKVHPANIVKNRRDGIDRRPSELDVIEQLGPPPAHVHVLDASTDISTLSLFEVGDICVTVRGTVGLECACFGLTTITAGTGRYDHKGFTLDPDSQHEFLSLIENPRAIPRATSSAIERARRYAYGVFLQRPVQYKCIRFGFNQDAMASTRIDVETSMSLLSCPEVVAMSDYISSGDIDFIDHDRVSFTDEP